MSQRLTLFETVAKRLWLSLCLRTLPTHPFVGRSFPFPLLCLLLLAGVPGFAASNKFGGSLHEENNYRLELGREGRPCQLPYNLGPGEERRLSRYNMVDQKDTVAEVQCKVQCAADGTPIVVSMGDSATLWRSAGGAWNPLYKGQEQVLSAGDQLSLDANDPEAAVFVCNAPGGAGQAVGSTGGLPAGWVAQVDEASGVTYYSNTDTGECQWEVPQ